MVSYVVDFTRAMVVNIEPENSEKILRSTASPTNAVYENYDQRLERLEVMRKQLNIELCIQLYSIVWSQGKNPNMIPKCETSEL